MACEILRQILVKRLSIEYLDQFSCFRHGSEQLKVTDPGVNFETPKMSTELNNFGHSLPFLFSK